MLSILIMAILGAISWDSSLNILKSTSQNNPLDLGMDPNLGYARAYHNLSVDFELNSMVYEGGQPGIVTTNFATNLVSKFDLIFNFNFLNIYVLNFKIATNPFNLTPLWCAFYYTSVFDRLKNE